METPPDRAWGRLSRRTFVRGVGVGGLGVLAGCGRLPWQAPPPKVARIGFLGTGSREGHAFVLGELLLGLRELGYIEGQTILIEYRFSEQGGDRLPALAAEVARTSPDVIVTDGTPAALAARESVETTPIVMVRNADPVGNGLVASLARPGGRITGLSSYGPQLSRKRLDVLKETVPGLMRVGVPWDPASRSNPAIELQFRETQAAGEILGVQVLSLQVGGGGELQPAFHTAMQESVEALVVFGDPFSFSQRAQI